MVDDSLRDLIDWMDRRIWVEQAALIAGEPSPSHDNMLRCGFQEIRVRPTFAPEGMTWQPR